MKRKIFPLIVLIMITSCMTEKKQSAGQDGEIGLVVIDPGHFHAALLQKQMYENVNPVVHVYAPEGPELEQYLGYIRQYNNRENNPTRWEEIVYRGDDFLSEMINKKKGNVLIVSGNNKKKTTYIEEAIKAGMNVFADKPLAIHKKDFDLLVQSFRKAKEKNLLIYDIMTERFEITNMLQKELSLLPAVFGTLEQGTPEHPAVIKESVHHFMKFASGNPVIRPTWYFDTEQQGEGLVDVTTHLIDLIQWTCFPEVALDYSKDVEILNSNRWSTILTKEQFLQVTNTPDYPSFLQKDVKDEKLHVYANGEMNYQLKGIHIKIRVRWDYMAPEGTGDTHYSIIRGTKSNLIVRQGAEQGYKPVLYIQPIQTDYASFEKELIKEFEQISSKYEGVSLKRHGNEWEVLIPQAYHIGHETHFGQVAENYFSYLTEGNIPDWEVPCMLTKYYITTQAALIAEPKNNTESL